MSYVYLFRTARVFNPAYTRVCARVYESLFSLRRSLSRIYPMYLSIDRNACMSFYARTSQVIQSEDETFEVVLDEESVSVMIASLVTHMENNYSYILTPAGKDIL